MGLRDYDPNIVKPSKRTGLRKYDPNIVSDVGDDTSINKEGSIITDLPSSMLEANLFMQKGIAQFIGATGKVAGNKKIVDWSKKAIDDLDLELREGFSAVGRDVGWDQPARKLTRILGQGIASSGMGYAGGITGGTIAKTLGYAPKTASYIGTLLGVAPMGVASAGQFFSEGDAAGRRDDINYLHSIAMGVGIAYLEGLPAFHWLKGGFGTGKRTLMSTLRAAGKQGVMEATEEAAQNIWTAVNKAVGWKGTQDLYKDAVEGLVEQMLGGFMVGGLMGGIGGPQYEDFVADTQRKWTKAGVVGNGGKPLTTADVEAGLEQIRNDWNMQDSLVRDRLQANLAKATAGTTVSELVARPSPEPYTESVVRKGKRGNKVVVKEGVPIKLDDKQAEGDRLKMERDRQRKLDDKWKFMNFQIGPRDFLYSELPAVMKQIIESVARVNDDASLLGDGTEANPGLFNTMLSENVAYTTGGVAESEDTSVPASERAVVFFGPLQKARNWDWRKEKWTNAEKISPNLSIRELAAVVAASQGKPGAINPLSIKFRGEGAGEAHKTFLDVYNKANVQFTVPTEVTVETEEEFTKKEALDVVVDEITRRIELDKFKDTIKKTWADIKRVNKNVSLANRRMLGWLRKMMRTGRLDVRGIEVNTLEDVAGVASMFRNPSIEIGQTIFVKDGKIIWHSAYEAKGKTFRGGSPISSPAADVRKEVDIFAPDEIYVVHNHPSGNPEPSIPDIEVHDKFVSMYGDVYKGHIVLDGEEFSFLDSTKEAEATQGGRRIKYSGISFKPDMVIKDRKQLGKVVNDKFKKNKVMIIYLTAERRVLSMEYMARDNLTPEKVVDRMHLHKAAQYIIALRGFNSKDIQALNNELPRGVSAIIYDDVVSGKQQFLSVKELEKVKRRDPWERYEYKGQLFRSVEKDKIAAFFAKGGQVTSSGEKIPHRIVKEGGKKYALPAVSGKIDTEAPTYVAPGQPVQPGVQPTTFKETVKEPPYTYLTQSYG